MSPAKTHAQKWENYFDELKTCCWIWGRGTDKRTPSVKRRTWRVRSIHPTRLTGLSGIETNNKMARIKK